MCRISNCFSFFFCKHRWYRLSCLPFVWHFFYCDTHTHTNIHAHAHTHTQTHTHARTHTHTHTLTRARTHTHIPSRAMGIFSLTPSALSFVFLWHTHTHTHTRTHARTQWVSHSRMYQCRVAKQVYTPALLTCSTRFALPATFCLIIFLFERSSRQRPRRAMSWKTLEKSGLEPAAPNHVADRKHCALSTQPNPHLQK